MEKVLKNCEMFSENVNCDLNAMTSECNETRVALIKHCTHKECGGKYVPLETQQTSKERFAGIIKTGVKCGKQGRHLQVKGSKHRVSCFARKHENRWQNCEN